MAVRAARILRFCYLLSAAGTAAVAGVRGQSTEPCGAKFGRGDAKSYLHAGFACENLGQHTEALEAFQRAGFKIVFVVDDNLIGNKKAIKPILRDIVRWQQARAYPADPFHRSLARSC